MDTPLITGLPKSHPAYYVDGPDHLICSDPISGRFSIYITGDIDVNYTDKDGNLHNFKSTEDILSSAALTSDEAPNLAWIEQPWFKLIDENGEVLYGEVFDNIYTVSELALDAAIRTSNG